MEKRQKNIEESVWEIITKNVNTHFSAGSGAMYRGNIYFPHGMTAEVIFFPPINAWAWFPYTSTLNMCNSILIFGLYKFMFFFKITEIFLVI